MSSRVYVPKNQLCRTNFQRESRFEKYKDFEEKKTPLQEEQTNKVKQPEQQADDMILLIDPHNREYEDLPDDTTDDTAEEEFIKNDDVSSDAENDVSD